jgi:hypothetical protein
MLQITVRNSEKSTATLLLAETRAGGFRASKGSWYSTPADGRFTMIAGFDAVNVS